ncbi:ubiquitin-protein ligase peroxin 12 [Homalodisca vitripennis]|nr:ubiquitin-protein ligase peroxin 12 [Homalodisca vitripennis]
MLLLSLGEKLITTLISAEQHMELTNKRTTGLQLAAFFLQCLQWYHSDQLSHDKLSNLIPHPPVVEEINILSPAQCPVCKKPCRIETVLMTSGYVFCYRCIREAIIARQSCPVTNLPATLDELIRLFPNK